MVARRSAAGERTLTVDQARALILTGPGELRALFAGRATAGLAADLAALRPRPGDVPCYATASRCASWVGARSSWTARPPAWTSSWSRWSLPAPRACWPCTASALSPPPCS
jgi:hypothetical protein